MRGHGIVPPIIETTVVLWKAVVGLAVVSKVAPLDPLGLALAIAGGRRCDFQRGVHFGKSVRQGRRGFPTVGLGIVEEGPQMPLSGKIGPVPILKFHSMVITVAIVIVSAIVTLTFLLVGRSKGVSHRKGVRGGKLKVQRRTIPHIAAPVHVIDAIPKVVPSRQHRGPGGRAHGATAVKVLQHQGAGRLGPGVNVGSQGRPAVVSEIRPSNVVRQEKQKAGKRGSRTGHVNFVCNY